MDILEEENSLEVSLQVNIPAGKKWETWKSQKIKSESEKFHVEKQQRLKEFVSVEGKTDVDSLKIKFEGQHPIPDTPEVYYSRKVEESRDVVQRIKLHERISLNNYIYQENFGLSSKSPIRRSVEDIMESEDFSSNDETTKILPVQEQSCQDRQSSSSLETRNALLGQELNCQEALNLSSSLETTKALTLPGHVQNCQDGLSSSSLETRKALFDQQRNFKETISTSPSPNKNEALFVEQQSSQEITGQSLTPNGTMSFEERLCQMQQMLNATAESNDFLDVSVSTLLGQRPKVLRGGFYYSLAKGSYCFMRKLPVVSTIAPIVENTVDQVLTVSSKLAGFHEGLTVEGSDTGQEGQSPQDHQSNNKTLHLLDRQVEGAIDFVDETIDGAKDSVLYVAKQTKDQLKVFMLHQKQAAVDILDSVQTMTGDQLYSAQEYLLSTKVVELGCKGYEKLQPWIQPLPLVGSFFRSLDEPREPQSIIGGNTRIRVQQDNNPDPVVNFQEDTTPSNAHPLSLQATNKK